MKMKTFILRYANGNVERIRAKSWIYFYRNHFGNINVFGLVNIRMDQRSQPWKI